MTRSNGAACHLANHELIAEMVSDGSGSRSRARFAATWMDGSRTMQCVARTALARRIRSAGSGAHLRTQAVQDGCRATWAQRRS